MSERCKDDKGIIWQMQSISGQSVYAFRKKLLGEYMDSPEANPQRWQNIKTADYLDKTILRDARRTISNRDRWKNRANDFFLNYEQVELVCKLIDILETDPKYAKRNPSSGKFSEEDKIPYDATCVKELLTSMRKYVNDHDRTFEALDYAWYIMYLAICKKLPSDFRGSSKVRHDMEEYGERVLRRYGSMTMPAYRTIVGLANAGNVVALTELGELYYNGRLTSGKPQYQKAFRCFLEAAGMPDENREARYPLACWNMAYILFNYQFRQDLKRAYIYDLQDTKSKLSDREERQKEAIRYCLLGIKLDETCVPLFNLLGVILDVLESVSTENENQQEAESAKNMMKMITQNSDICDFFQKDGIIPEDFFEYASERNYTEADNNLARRACKKILSAKTNESKKKHLELALKYFGRASDNFGTWASNKLGEFYRTGIINIFFEEKEETKQLYFPECQDDYLAKQYYQKAIEIFADEHSAWASIHLLESYYDELEEEVRTRCEDILRNTKNKELQEKYQSILRQKNRFFL